MAVPQVSIGLPFRNNQQTLKTAIQSVFAQTESDWELLLIDDGSTDASLEIARSIDDERVRVFADGANHGLAARLNQVTQLARAQYVARMDADDVMHPARLATQIDLLDSDEALDLVASAAYVIDDDDQVLAIAGSEPFHDSPTAYLSNHVFIHPTVTARRAWMEKNPYDARFRRGQDKELWCRTFPTSNFYRSSEPLLYFRDFKSFSLPTYAATRKFDREIIRLYGPRIVGSYRTRVMALRTYAKVALYACLRAVRMEQVMMRRRYVSLTKEQMLRAHHGLEIVRAVRIGVLGSENHRETVVDIKNGVIL